MSGYFVVISGASGSGKTTVARELAPALGLPLISKDTIKESIADVLGYGDIEWSRRLGAAAFEAMYALAAESGSAVLETHWYRDQCIPRLSALGRPIIEVFCRCDGVVLRARLADRLAKRHPIHLDAIDPHYVEVAAADALDSGPLGLGPIFELDTSHALNVQSLAAWVNSQASHVA